MRFVIALLALVVFASVSEACNRCGRVGSDCALRSREIIQEDVATRQFGQEQTIIDERREIVEGRVVTPFREERVLQQQSFESVPHCAPQAQVFTEQRVLVPRFRSGGSFGGSFGGLQQRSFAQEQYFARSAGSFGGSFAGMGVGRPGLLGRPILMAPRMLVGSVLGRY